jgi:hypothetical protein
VVNLDFGIASVHKASMNDNLKPGTRVLDLRAVCRSGGMFAGLITAPLVAGLSGWSWTWCAIAAVVTAAAGFIVAGVIGRIAFPAPHGQVLVTPVGAAALGIAVSASLAGGAPIALACTIAAFVGSGATGPAITLLIGIAVSAGVGCLAALV